MTTRSPSALCCAHLLRDLAGIGQVARHQRCADDIADLLAEAKGAIAAAVAADGARCNNEPTTDRYRAANAVLEVVLDGRTAELRAAKVRARRPCAPALRL